MLSRVADALYWMGRYLERSENITRLLLVTEDFSAETQGLAEQVAQSAWKDLLAIFPSAHVAPAASAFAPMSQAYLAGFFLDASNPFSVHYSLRKGSYVVNSSQGGGSKDTWVLAPRRPETA